MGPNPNKRRRKSF